MKQQKLSMLKKDIIEKNSHKEKISSIKVSIKWSYFEKQIFRKRIVKFCRTFNLAFSIAFSFNLMIQINASKVPGFLQN